MNKAAQKQPIIGIVPTFDDGVVIDAGGASIERVYLRRDYLGAISSVGAIPFIITPEISMDSLQDICDGIVISGGLDIDPPYVRRRAFTRAA